MPKQQVIVTYTGDQFVAYDTNGNLITDRKVLEQLSFMQFSGLQITEMVEVDVPDGLAEPLAIQVSIHPSK